jgi:hypothetical protein
MEAAMPLEASSMAEKNVFLELRIVGVRRDRDEYWPVIVSR